eukprot:m.38805 g.38805  ORF g.38805 m.38805 type:complete len:134 (-) comp14673_c0_seq4:235-636(-)
MLLSAQRESKGLADWLCCMRIRRPEARCMGAGTLNCVAEPPLTNFIRRWYVPNLLKPIGKAVAAAITVGFFSFSVWSAVQLEMDFNPEWFAPKDPYLEDAFYIRDAYWDSSQIPGIVAAASLLCCFMVDEQIG